jgi:hypothetical protein
LQHNDVIELGAFYLRYLNPRASAERDLERTMLIAGLQGLVRQPSEAPPEEVHVPSARAPSIRFPKGSVRMTTGSRAGETIELDRVVATFGRPGAQLAVITRRPQGYFITHVEGRRYPRVNRQFVGTDAHALRHGDVVDVGDEKLEFSLD